jgi:hypothetical protein
LPPPPLSEIGLKGKGGREKEKRGKEEVGMKKRKINKTLFRFLSPPRALSCPPPL